MPHYRTMVYLGAALLEIRKREAMGRHLSSDKLPPELEKYVGTMRQIRRRAPKTLFAVQSMPEIPDHLQSVYLKRETR